MNPRLRNVQHGFSTIGCPDASLSEARALALRYALDFIELRALAGTIDLPAHFAREPVSDDDRMAHPPVRLVATGLQLMEADDKDIETFLRYVDVADQLGAPFVRVFGGGEWGDTPRRSNGNTPRKHWTGAAPLSTRKVPPARC